MKALLGKVGKVLGPVLFREATVTRVEEASEALRVVRLESPSLRTVSFAPGDKVQVFLPDVGLRTYTPFGWEPGAFGLVVLARPGTTPGARFARGVAVGDRVRFFGPRRSVTLTGPASPVMVFGDETSVALALALATTAPRLHAVLEATRASDVTPVLARSGLEARVVARGGSHFDEVEEQLLRGLAAAPEAKLVLTGAAPSIQEVSRRLRARGVRAQSVKAYWAPGKVGLD